jgi:hypothetical protein
LQKTKGKDAIATKQLQSCGGRGWGGGSPQKQAAEFEDVGPITWDNESC